MRQFKGKPVSLMACVIFDAFKDEWPRGGDLSPAWYLETFLDGTGDREGADSAPWCLIADIFNSGEAI